MAMKKINYYIDGKKEAIEVKICDSIVKKFSGLMFRKNSPPLLFVFNKSKNLSIHSFFCRPFRAIWLNEKMESTKIVDVKTWKIDISGKGKYLLEVPISFKSNEFPSRKRIVENRNI